MGFPGRAYTVNIGIRLFFRREFQRGKAVGTRTQARWLHFPLGPYAKMPEMIASSKQGIYVTVRRTGSAVQAWTGFGPPLMPYLPVSLSKYQKQKKKIVPCDVYQNN